MPDPATPMDITAQPTHSNMNRTLGLNNTQGVRFDYKDFFKTIPEFDNSPDGYPIQSFIENCEDAKEYVAQCGEKLTVRMLCSKCKGEPLKRVSRGHIQTIDQLIGFLNLHFRPRKDISVWIGEFSKFKQRPDEKIIDFNFRLGSHLELTLREIELKGGPHVEARKTVATETAIRMFKAGIFQRIRLFLSAREYVTLNEVVTEAMEIEEQQNEMEGIEKLFPTSSKECLPIQTSQTVQKTCNYCKKPGHLIQDCRKRMAKNNENQQRTNNATNGNQPRVNAQSSTITCNYCKKTGHLIQDCRKREYNNSRKANNGNVSGQSRPSGNEQQAPRTGATSGNPAAPRRNETSSPQ